MSKSKRGYVMGLPKMAVQRRGDSLVYLFDADFSVMADAAPLTSPLAGQVGVFDITNPGDARINGGYYEVIPGGSIPALAYTSLITRNAGIAIFAKNWRAVSGQTNAKGYVGFGSSKDVLPNPIAWYNTGAVLNVRADAAQISIGTLVDPTAPMQYLIIMRKRGAYVFGKGDVLGSNWTLQWTGNTSYVDLYAVVFGNNVNSRAMRISRFSGLRLPGAVDDAVPGNGLDVADSKDLDVRASIASPAVGNTFTHTPDCVINFGVTTVGTGGTHHRIKYRAEVDGAATGTAYLIRVEIGVGYQIYKPSGTALITAAGAPVDGDTVTVVCRGQTQSLFVNGVLKGSATDSANTDCIYGLVYTKPADGVLSNLTVKTLNGIGQAAPLTQVTDYGGNGLHGVPTAVGLVGAPSEGGQYNGASSKNNIYSASLASKVNLNEIGIIARIKCPASAWTNGVSRKVITLGVDGSNLVEITRWGLTNNMMTVRHLGSSTSKAVNYNLGPTPPTDFFNIGLSVSVSGDALYGVYEGTPSAKVTGMVSVAGALSSTRAVIGAEDTTPAEGWLGSLAHLVVTLNGVVPTTAQQTAVQTHFDDGTLTTTILDAMFGANNYLWYRHDDRKAVALPGLATDVLAGPRAAASLDWYTHEADFRLSFVVQKLAAAADYHFLRFKDVDNNLYCGVTAAGAFGLGKKIAGSVSALITTANGTVAVGDTLTVVMVGSSITVYNGVTVLGTATESTLVAQTIGRTGNLVPSTGIWRDIITRPYTFTAAAAPLTPGAAILEGAFTLMES